MLKLISGEAYFPLVAEKVGPRQPKLLLLEQPDEPRKTHVTPYFFHRSYRACPKILTTAERPRNSLVAVIAPMPVAISPGASGSPAITRPP